MSIKSAVLASLALLTATLPVASAQSVQDTIYRDRAEIIGRDGFGQSRVIFRAAQGQRVTVTLPCTFAGCSVAFNVQGWVPTIDSRGNRTLMRLVGYYEVVAPQLEIGRRVSRSPTTVVAGIERLGTLMATNKVKVIAWDRSGKWAWVSANFAGRVNYQDLSKAHRPAGS